jgi:hypothetical protein
MSLETKTTVAKAIIQGSAKVAVTVPVTEPKVTLELAIYDRYTRGNKLFVKKDEASGRPVAYGFTPQQARVLLQEVDGTTDRPVWRRPRPANRVEIQQKFVGQNMVLDASAATIEETPIDPDAMPEARIDFGSDDELMDIPGLIDSADMSGAFEETTV